MTEKRPKNVAASVRERLLNLARARGEDFNLVLTRYASERLLYRLSTSSHEARFILKGAALFSVWTGEPHRATRDLDLLGVGDPNPDAIAAIFRALCGAQVHDDGLEFDRGSVSVRRIKEEQEYEGVRVELLARLGVAKIPVQVDVGFGDAVTPKPAVLEFPTLLDSRAPMVRTYPRETVVAEKLHAMVVLGMANSRMKDFYDVWLLARRFEFAGETLAAAVGTTFDRRRTPVPEVLPLALSNAFSADEGKQKQWAAFIRRSKPIEIPENLEAVVTAVAAFVVPVLKAATNPRAPLGAWPPAGPWSAPE